MCGAERISRRRFITLAGAIAVFALLLRLLYVFTAHVEQPIAGDINQYVLYAWNLINNGTFSSSLPDGSEAVPDNIRGPGYPIIIALSMLLSGNTDLQLSEMQGGYLALLPAEMTWVYGVYVLQAFLGALTVVLVIIIARHWLSRTTALCCGLLVAAWPHLISFSGVMLSETVFGFLLVLSLWLLLLAEEHRRSTFAAFAGLALAAAWLVNPVIAMFPLLAAIALLVRRKKNIAIAMLACFAMAPAGWAWRNASVGNPQGSSERAMQNFVQGSWPKFLSAFNARHTHPLAAAYVQAEQDEEHAFLDTLNTGIDSMWKRMKAQPMQYVLWYAVEKPFLLWDWRIRLGSGDVYFLVTTASPFEKITLLRWTKEGFRICNPLFFLLGALATLVIAWRLVRHPRATPFAPGMVALLLTYLTAVHVVLQAEPRYSIPYRPEQLLMVMSAVTWLSRRVMALKRNSDESYDTNDPMTILPARDHD